MIDTLYSFKSYIGNVCLKYEQGNLYNVKLCASSEFIRGQEVENDSVQMKDLKNIQQQIIQYLSCERKQFDLEQYLNWLLSGHDYSQTHAFGTPFQRRVWRTLLEIPYGKCLSYSDVAEKAGCAKSVRAVANAIGANPLIFVIPCHRVIRKNGQLGGFSAGLDVKKVLLKLEKGGQL